MHPRLMDGCLHVDAVPDRPYFLRRSPEDIVKCVDFRWISDAITPDEAVALLTENRKTMQARIKQMETKGMPACKLCTIVIVTRP